MHKKHSLHVGLLQEELQTVLKQMRIEEGTGFPVKISHKKR